MDGVAFFDFFWQNSRRRTFGNRIRCDTPAMELYSLVRIQHLPIPLEQAWQFFTEPYHLLKITPITP